MALDTFVLERAYTVVEDQQDSRDGETDTDAEAETDTDTETQTEAEPETDTDEDTDNALSYDDGNISITVTEYREYDTSIYVADVLLSGAEYLQTAFAEDTYGKNVTAVTSQIAAENGAILAINGDFYGSQERGYVLRNGVLYRETASKRREALVIGLDGAFSVVLESQITAQELLEQGAWQVLSFGPALVTGGEVAVSEDEEVGKAKASNPRTAIAAVDALHYLFLVSDGRTDESEGLSLYELACFAQALGAATAYNLDGGGSSTMYFNGQVINNPTSSGKSIKEREVSDIVFIGY
ncbi:MAG: phosphodiester glycosidase family protein [Oscillospiraceae bacterium]|nr:phosphodiester glycosidase family protein [Oscillospiraceae bacterium]